MHGIHGDVSLRSIPARGAGATSTLADEGVAEVALLEIVLLHITCRHWASLRVPSIIIEVAPHGLVAGEASICWH